ncbi:hypothetical protein MLD38_037474 [Melastoma candidum]|uniref:Uncharacterized protein n=1 Tax=Melastoma candidum TaxID=119954 RepID=A0ACB9LN51_9MYRT|nr:hypothetical protein MLD38_037474 [Melastoma candidum]
MAVGWVREERIRRCSSKKNVVAGTCSVKEHRNTAGQSRGDARGCRQEYARPLLHPEELKLPSRHKVWRRSSLLSLCVSLGLAMEGVSVTHPAAYLGYERSGPVVRCCSGDFFSNQCDEAREKTDCGIFC